MAAQAVAQETRKLNLTESAKSFLWTAASCATLVRIRSREYKEREINLLFNGRKLKLNNILRIFLCSRFGLSQ